MCYINDACKLYALDTINSTVLWRSLFKKMPDKCPTCFDTGAWSVNLNSNYLVKFFLRRMQLLLQSNSMRYLPTPGTTLFDLHETCKSCGLVCQIKYFSLIWTFFAKNNFFTGHECQEMIKCPLSIQINLKTNKQI